MAAKKTVAEALAAPFKAAQIQWRVGSTTQDKTRGMALPYIDARAVMDRLDEVVGPENWQDSYVVAADRTICTLELLVDVKKTDSAEWVRKSDGAGDTNYEGEKGAISDAFKRAAVKWGVGRFLYDMEAPWVEVVSYGNPNKPSYKIAPSAVATLNAIANRLPGAKVKAEAAPPAEQPQSGNGEPEPETPTKQPPGVVLLALMRVRCIELGIDDTQAGQVLNEIITVDLALDKSTKVFTEHMENIKAKVLQWTPSG